MFPPCAYPVCDLLQKMFDKQKENYSLMYNNQRPMFINILLVVLLFLVVGSLFSAVVGIVGSLLWLAVKILVPVAIIVWLVRTISGNNGNCRRRY